jgi:hypothetical protein
MLCFLIFTACRTNEVVDARWPFGQFIVTPRITRLNRGR